MMYRPSTTLRSLAIAACLGLLGACATDIMQAYVGQPMESAMARYGPPDHIFDLPDGRRAFQWVEVNASTSAGYAVTRTIDDVNARPDAYRDRRTSVTTTEVNPPTTSINRCFYTMYARYDETSGGWVFVSFERPEFGC